MAGSDPTDTSQLSRLIANGLITAAHSPVYLWLRRNHDGLLAQFGDTRIRWASMAATLVSLGVTDANGAPPRAATIRRTWWRVRRDVALAQARSEAKPPKPAVSDVVRPVAAASSHKPASPPPVFDPTEGADEPPPPRRFGISRIPK